MYYIQIYILLHCHIVNGNLIKYIYSYALLMSYDNKNYDGAVFKNSVCHIYFLDYSKIHTCFEKSSSC